MTTSCHFKHDNNVEITLPDHPWSAIFKIRPESEIQFRNIVNYMLNKNIIGIETNIIDLGAWMGDNAIPWAKNIKGTVYAIDPSPENCKFIEDLKVLNKIYNVITIQKAISDRDTTLSTNESLTHCSFVYNNPGQQGVNKVQATTLDQLYFDNIITNIGFIHLDVEGMESLVIGGAHKLVDAFRPIIAFEQHLWMDDYKGLAHIIADKGYRVYLINEVLPGCRPDCRNFVALPEEKHPLDFVNDIHSALLAKDLLLAVIE